MGAGDAIRRPDRNRAHHDAGGRTGCLSGRRAARHDRERHDPPQADAGRDAGGTPLQTLRPRRLSPAARHAGRHRGVHARPERHDASRRAALLHGGAARRRAASGGRARPICAARPDGLRQPAEPAASSLRNRCASAARRVTRSSRPARTSAPATISCWCSGCASAAAWCRCSASRAAISGTTVLPRMRALRDGFASKQSQKPKPRPKPGFCLQA